LGHLEEEVKVSYLDEVRPLSTGMRKRIQEKLKPINKVFETQVHNMEDPLDYTEEFMVELRYRNKFFVRPDDTEALEVMTERCVREIKEAIYEEIIPHCLHLERAIYEENIPEARATLRKIMDKVLY
jgi:hypothetical protein